MERPKVFAEFFWLSAVFFAYLLRFAGKSDAKEKTKPFTPGVKGYGLGELFGFIGQYADCFVELSKDFVQSWVGLLNDESSEITGLALLYLGSLHDIIIAATVGAEPADEETAA